jgi:alpha-L-arabinofuranosidase
LGFGVFSLALFLAASASAATTINLSTNVLVPQVKRFGMNLGYNNYFDSGQMLKELLFTNPGFEALQFQSEVQLGAGGTATSAIEGLPFTQWPSGFWDGASYEFIYGAAKGRTGTVTRSLAPNRASPPNDPAGSTQGTTYQFAESGVVAANGDYMLLRKYFPGGGTTGWNLSTQGAARADTELADLPPNTPGRQCVRLSATNSGDYLQLSSANDSLGTFVLLNGQFRLSFAAKGAGGANRLLVSLVRGNTSYFTTNLALTTGWQTYQFNFAAAELPTVTGAFSVQFTPVNQSAVLLDDVSLRQTDGDPTNPTAFRDAVVNALRGFNPGILRAWHFRLGDSLLNQTAAPFARVRTAHTAYATNEAKLEYDLHESIGLAAHLGAEWWFTVPVTFSTNEMAGLMEYLAGPTNTFWGARRAARGRVAPWTDTVPRIHLEFGNEQWNSVFRGGAIELPDAYAARTSEMFSVAKATPYYSSNRFTFVLGSQAPAVDRSVTQHNRSAHHDVVTVAPYLGFRVDNFATTEELFGSLFAEGEMVSRSPDTLYGYMRETRQRLQATGRPVPVSIYEVNTHTTEGAIDQATLDGFASSLGAGLAVADHMLMMLRELQARDQCLFSLPGHRYTRGDGKTVPLWGVVRDMGVTDRKRPQYFSVQLANAALAGDLLQTTHTGDDPTWSVNNLNRVILTNAHHLRTYATANGTSRALVVFNLHRTSALDVNFAGSNAPSGTVTLKRLTSANLTDHNENATVVAPTTNTLSNFNPAANLSLPPFSMNVLEWTVAAAAVAPAITTQPQSQTVNAGANVTFTVAASGTAPLAYQWRRDGVILPGATGASLGLNSVQPADAGSYSVVVSNSAGFATSAAATLTVNVPVTPPGIVVQPQSAVVVAGSNVTLSATVTGTPPLTFQWQRNNVNLPGATTSTLTLANVTRAQTGSYVLQVSNPGGATASQPAVVRVLNFPRLRAPEPLPGGGLRLRFQDHDGGLLTLGDTPNFEVWVSTNLTSTNWLRLNLPLTVDNGLLTLDDPAAPNHARRFYRVLER